MLTTLILFSLIFSPMAMANCVVISAQDNSIFSDLQIPIYTWSQPNTTPRAIILALHGGCLHGTSYETLGDSLASQGFLLVSFDMRGYGKWLHENYGGKENQTFNYKKTRADVTAILERLDKAYKDVPIFLIGESLGANSAAVVAHDNPDLIDGVILVSPYSFPKVFFYPMMFVTLAQFCTNPARKLDFNYYLKRRLAYNTSLAMEELKDPMNRNKQSARELFSSLGINLRGRRNMLQFPSNLPVFVLIGQNDNLCYYKTGLRLFNRMPVKDKKLYVIPEHGHLIVETPYIKPEVISVLTTWIIEHSNPPIQQTASAK